ncbi:MAG: PadR family transcriptional regulator [Bacteroidota bacterium]
MHSPELLKGTLQTIILKLLEDHGKMYGYEITQKVKELSSSKILLTEGSLYPMLHKMVAEGLLQTEDFHIGKRVRKYYKLTADGSEAVSVRIAEFTDFIKTMSVVLKLHKT